jgi:decaprenylphospho-beta-D-erythro-pentofuranosid-2-ulose 2-reductase
MKDALGDVQSVLVLGGGSDLADAVVRRLVARRCRRVVLTARHPERLEPFAAELRAVGAAVDMVPFDADRAEEHNTVIEDAFARHGDVDLVIVAFGVLDDGAAALDAAAAVAAVRTNYVGAVSVGLVVGEYLRRQGHGTLVFFSSVAGQRARRANFVYGSSKAGLDAFAQGLGDALASDGIRVIVVRPGFAPTKMTAGRPPAPLPTTVDAVADAVVAAIRSGQEVVWVPPALRYAFAILRHVPRSLWRRLSAY